MISTDVNAIRERKFMWERKDYVVYSLVNLDNGKRYIGITTNPKKRIMSHFSALSSHRHINAFINKDSNCRFGYEILEEGLAYEEKKRERDYMKLFRTNDERYGYNVKDPFFRGH